MAVRLAGFPGQVGDDMVEEMYGQYGDGPNAPYCDLSEAAARFAEYYAGPHSLDFGPLRWPPFLLLLVRLGTCGTVQSRQPANAGQEVGRRHPSRSCRPKIVGKSKRSDRDVE